MPDEDLPALVRRRLFELASTARDASRRSGWTIGPETIQRLARGAHSARITERLARALSRALDVPENRVRRVSGLPLVHDPRALIHTGPHLRLVRPNGETDE